MLEEKNTIKNEEGEDMEVSKKEQSDSELLKDEAVKSEEPKREQIVVTEDTFWDKLAWLRLSVEEKAILAEGILDEIENKPLYWIQLIVSVMIITFGLLQNSVAVVIGGMLIAPILKPIKGLAFGITTGQARFFWRSVLMMFLSIVFAVFTAYLFSLIIPLKIETPEILARTSPNILDLMIAVSSGIIAMLSLYFKKLSESVAGVAMAAALMPPLAVVGIELALSNSAAAGGSSFLFVTNLFAILAVGVIIFLFYGFSPHHAEKKSKNVALRVAAILFSLLIYISFPLFASLKSISERIELQSLTASVLETSLEEHFPEASVSSININDFDDDFVDFSGILKVEEGAEFLLEDQETVYADLKEKLGIGVEMELQIVPVVLMSDGE